MNAERYFDILKQVWEEIRFCSSKALILVNARWSMASHNGGRPDLPSPQFKGHVISRRSEIEWPSYLPELNVHNYFLWSYPMIHIQRHKPAASKESEVVVKDIVRTVPVDITRAAVANVWKRSQACIQAEGGPFVAFLK